MRLRLGIVAALSLVLAVVATASASFVVDPENIGIRLALYAVAFLALLGAILCGVFAVVVTKGPGATPQDALVPQAADEWPGE